MKLPQLLAGGGAAAPDAAEKGRVGGKTPAHHHRAAPGEGGVGGGGDVAVIHQGEAGGPEGGEKHVTVGGAGIEFLLDAGVDGELVEGVFFIHRQQLGPLHGVIAADAGLDGDGHMGQGGEDFRQHPVQLPGVGEEAGALMLGHHRAAGTAQVEVHLMKAHFLQLTGGPDEILRAVGEELGHQIRLAGGDLPQLFGLEGQIGVGGEKGGVVAVRAAEDAAVGGAPDGGGDALQGGGVELNHENGPPGSPPA